MLIVLGQVDFQGPELNLLNSVASATTVSILGVRGPLHELGSWAGGRVCMVLPAGQWRLEPVLLSAFVFDFFFLFFLKREPCGRLSPHVL